MQKKSGMAHARTYLLRPQTFERFNMFQYVLKHYQRSESHAKKTLQPEHLFLFEKKTLNLSANLRYRNDFIAN